MIKALPPLCLALGVITGAATHDSLAAANRKGGLDILIVADAVSSPEGFRPKPGQPIHYLFGQNRVTLGESIAAVKFPDPVTVENAIVRELEKQGFSKTGVGGPLPEIVILAVIGDANFEPPPLPAFVDPLDEPDFGPYLRMVDVRKVLQPVGLLRLGRVPTVEEIFDPNECLKPDFDSSQTRELVLAEAIRIRDRGSARNRDRDKIMSLVSSSKVDKAVAASALSFPAAERIMQATHDNRLYLTLSAFDAARWKDKQRVLLWRTTMLIDWRENFSQSLAVMLAQAGPIFGTDMAVPGFINTATSQEGKVEIGDVKVVPEKSPTTTSREKN